eukprot:scaffold1938_cov113-Isochrysis_galbana.AAC.2
MRSAAGSCVLEVSTTSPLAGSETPSGMIGCAEPSLVCILKVRRVRPRTSSSAHCGAADEPAAAALAKGSTQPDRASAASLVAPKEAPAPKRTSEAASGPPSTEGSQRTARRAAPGWPCRRRTVSARPGTSACGASWASLARPAP